MANESSSDQPVLALREFFGDGKPPDISRKITACVACRKLKIKCHMTNSAPPCSRCKKRGMNCTVNRSLQMLLESDVTWKRGVEKRLSFVEEVLGKFANAKDSEILGSQKDSDGNLPEAAGPRSDTSNVSQGAHRPSVAWEVVIDPKYSPGAIPATCVSEVSNSSPPSHRNASVEKSDLISRGSIPLARAEHFLSVYRQRLDPFVYRILDQDSLTTIRAKSPLLTAAICAVAALHDGSAEYETCYKEFVTEYSSQMCSKRHTLDDVRGLCIGAFWLSDMSWALAGAAVRIATEMSLHRGVSKSMHLCITKTPLEKKLCYLRTRLYLIVYVCDHHFSVVYGRPPMTREFNKLMSARSLLELDFATEEDERLVGQVELWSINSRIYDTFGINTEAPLPPGLYTEFRRLAIALETWRADCGEKSTEQGNRFSSSDITLHFHFSKLYLCTHVFRGTTSSGPDPSDDLDEFANAAIYSATSIVSAVVTHQEIRSQLGALPTYFNTMIAFAVVFLLKMMMRNPASGRIEDISKSLELLSQLSTVLNELSSRLHSQHVLCSIAPSIQSLVAGFNRPRQQAAVQLETPSSAGLDMSNQQMNWLSPQDSMFLENFDIMGFQDGDFSMEAFGF